MRDEFVQSQRFSHNCHACDYAAMPSPLAEITRNARACSACMPHLPLGPRPVFQVHEDAKILIAAQAPGTKVHASGQPFTDASGDRLRDWMGIDADTFYDPKKIAILPMGFCYPGRGKSGDLPPRKECAPLWRQHFLSALENIQLTLVIGQYARDWHLPAAKSRTLTDTVRSFESFGAGIVPLPHPSPRNNIWLKKNPWFALDVLPALAERVAAVLEQD